MSDAPNTSPVPSSADPSANPAPQTQPHGYFNQAQLDETLLGEQILPAARSAPYAALLAGKDLDAPWIEGFAKALADARLKTVATGQAGDSTRAATLNAAGATRVLLVELHRIQSAAKQKHHMLAEDDDPATNFPLDGYLIGRRLNPNRALTITNADALIAKATADRLPGYKVEADFVAVKAALQAYKAGGEGQADATETASADRIARDRLIRKITARRLAIQHAIDGMYPFTEAANEPVRRLFKLPLHRPMPA